MGTPLEQQVQELGQQLQQLGMAFQQSQVDNRRLQDQLNTLSGGGPAVTPLIQALIASQTAMTEAMKKDDGKKVALIDNRGIGKPDKFTLEDKLSQVYAVLQNLLEGEAFVIIRNTKKGNGLEGWRKLNRRYDPATGAKKSSLLRHILTPGKCKLEELNEKVEQWMELLYLYEA